MGSGGIKTKTFPLIYKKSQTQYATLFRLSITDGKKNFKVIGVEFHPIPPDRKKCKVFYIFEEEGTHPPKIRMREQEYTTKLLEEGKLRYL